MKRAVAVGFALVALSAPGTAARAPGGSTAVPSGAAPPATAPPPGTIATHAFTTADGLAGDGVSDLFEDSRGYLWIATDAGLSRFDGHRFVNAFTGRTVVHRVREDREGRLWAATSAGLFVLDPALPVTGHEAWRRVTARPVGALLVDRAGVVWAGSGDRLLRVTPAAAGGATLDETTLDETILEETILDAPLARGDARWISHLAEDAAGRLWIGTSSGLVCRARDGALTHYGFDRDDPRSPIVHALYVEDDGRVWAALWNQTFVLRPLADAPGERSRIGPPLSRAAAAPIAADGPVRLDVAPGEALFVGAAHGFAGHCFFGDILRRADGTLAIASSAGLVTWTGRRFDVAGPARGLPEGLRALHEDRAGNLWLGTARGVFRVASQPFVNLDLGDGRDPRWASGAFTGRDGATYIVSRAIGGPGGPATAAIVERWDGRRFTRVARLPASADRALGWGWNQLAGEDRRGTVWLADGSLVGTFPRNGAPGRIDGSLAWAAARDTFRLFVDRAGHAWISSFPGPHVLSRVDGATGAVRIFTPKDGMPDGTPTAFAEEPDGTLWLGLYSGGLVRYRDGRFTTFAGSEERIGGVVGGILVEPGAAGAPATLWVASESTGLARVRVTAGDALEITRYGVGDGLSSEHVSGVARDAWGRLYLATNRGVDRFDPATGHVASFGTADGLSGSHVWFVHAATDGALWFGTQNGLSRYVPAPPAPRRAASVLFDALSVNGRAVPMPPLGAAHVDAPPAEPGPARVRAEVVALGAGAGAGRGPRFQYRLEDLERDWSTPTDQPVVEYAGVPPGRYVLAVRLHEPGADPPAAVARATIVVPAPVWQRGWFLALAVAVAGAAGFALHRLRTARLLALERQRTRIAMDLHDEIGSGLGSIGLLADLARQPDLPAERARDLAGQVGEIASDLGAGMAEILGALRPGGATLAALADRLREHATRMFPAEQEPRLVLSFPEDLPEIPLSLSIRRDVFLVAVEALHNARRHAAARTVALTLARDGKRWRLAIEDDGRGFDGSTHEARGRGGHENAGSNENAGGPGGPGGAGGPGGPGGTGGPGGAGGPAGFGSDEGIGLASMRRRAESIRAELRLERRAAGGTTLTLLFEARS